MVKKCKLSGKSFNNGYSVSHSHKRTKKRQYVNLQKKRIWSETQQKWITITLSTKALKSLAKGIYSI
uniref:Large ribosomal subunit protein bL28c n=1 Tax=Bangiopsis subsimplex TaxID=139980 RepID=A0A1C9CCQ5_9RHOD|nr:ribosomal protein L28 [Bangiopsis subsimplex]AOM66134.1 ribosomal protein L28 [Bangiopsis subsimplex]ARO90309.1 50S ribosomal protein L28 [Bangiopsis subsimplex]